MKRRVNILSSSKLSLKLLKLGLMQSLLFQINNNDTLVALKDVVLFMQGEAAHENATKTQLLLVTVGV
jgi:hypothetical protein